MAMPLLKLKNVRTTETLSVHQKQSFSLRGPLQRIDIEAYIWNVDAGGSLRVPKEYLVAASANEQLRSVRVPLAAADCGRLQKHGNQFSVIPAGCLHW